MNDRLRGHKERLTTFMPLYTILLTFSYKIHKIFNVEHVSKEDNRSDCETYPLHRQATNMV
jgi:hypothetical protein